MQISFFAIVAHKVEELEKAVKFRLRESLPTSIYKKFPKSCNAASLPSGTARSRPDF
ncbi:1821_t:CDS:2 [Diversispora eburnea]|uniref:1821_t:CDS:1 n=1 Tax=Diversispora eburnea TaxID=1213867 RepID=A0A9N8ZHF5_9GLOM|nr:1821_t:CDS:2 [Diversispora eburnea]